MTQKTESKKCPALEEFGAVPTFPNALRKVCEACPSLVPGKIAELKEAVEYFYEVRPEKTECHSPNCRDGEEDDSCAYHMMKRKLHALNEAGSDV